jgi:Histidinol dehydrogenase
MQLNPTRLNTASADFLSRLTEATAWESVSDDARGSRVAEIIADVRARGDQALIDYTQELDGHKVETADQLVLDESALESAFQSLPSDLQSALEVARDRIVSFHSAQKETSWRLPEADDGIVLGQEVRPMERVGIYVPGGKATYPSSVLMNAIPAKVAGVSLVEMVVPAPQVS